MEQYKFVHPFLSFQVKIALLNMVAGIMIICTTFSTHPIYLGIGLVLLISGFAFIRANRRSILRRYAVDPDYYRVPRYLNFSNYILWHRTSLRYVTWFVVFWFVLVSSMTFGFGLKMYLSIAALSCSSGVIAAAAIKLLIKCHVDFLFRIVIFRRNAVAFARSHIANVMPTCGTYGQILLLTDETLAATWEGGIARMDNWVLGETYQPLIADPRSLEEWKRVVATQLEYADFVVFDWPGEISDNMMWELEQTAASIPVQRMMMLVSHENHDAVEQTLLEMLQTDSLPDGFLAKSPIEPMLTLIFMRKFELVMNTLVRTPRPARLSATGLAKP